MPEEATPPPKAIAIVSSKGGVGKSSVTVNLALELQRRGVKVGLLDADIDSPYLAEIIGAKGKIDLDKDRRMLPVQWRGIPVMSFALWVPEQFSGATMSGQMHERWIQDAIAFTDWGPIDVLLCDLPAGSSSDEYVSVRNAFGKDFLGLIAVALPNVVSGLKRVYHTAGTHRMRILGVIENMVGPVFGSGKVEEFCASVGLRWLGSIPLDARVRERHERAEPELPGDLRTPIQDAAGEVQRAMGRKVVVR